MQRRMACVQGMVYPPRARHGCTQWLHKPQLFVEGQVFQHTASSAFFNAASPRAAAMALAKRRAVANENHVMRSIVGQKCLLKDGPQLGRLLVVNFVGVNFVCYCRATVDDDDANPLFMCSGDQRRCPGAGWFHPKCVGLKSVPKGNFFCQYCQTRPKPVKGR